VTTDAKCRLSLFAKRQNGYKSNLPPCSVEFCGKGFQFWFLRIKRLKALLFAKQPNRSRFSVFAEKAKL